MPASKQAASRKRPASSAPSSDAEVAGPPPMDAIAVKHPGRWVATGIVLIIALTLLQSAITNPRYRWDVVGEYLFSEPILSGLRLTMILTVSSMVLGIVLGIALAIMRLSPNPILSQGAGAYLWFFRGTPLLVQLIFWYNLSALYPTVSVAVPFGPTLLEGNANVLITPFVAAVFGLALNEAAYMAEIIRGGIIGVDRGQAEAAKAMGMTHMQTLRRIVLPQAMKLIIPPTGNQTILMLKTTSLVSVLALTELLYSAQAIYARTFQTMPLLIVVSIWYLALTSILTVGQFYLEKHFSEDESGATTGGLGVWFRRNILSFKAKTPGPTSKESTSHA